MVLKKPNTKYNESEIHIAEDASHALNIRPLTAREGEDVVRQLDFEQARKGVEKQEGSLSLLLLTAATATTPNVYRLISWAAENTETYWTLA